jgi:HEAT repeat protein
VVVVLATTTVANATGNRENGAMAAVLERVTEKDWDLLDESGAFSPSAAPDLLALLENEDREIRHLALHLVVKLGGEPARNGIAKALEDPDREIRGTAARFLLKIPDAVDMTSIHRHLREDVDEYVREHMALVSGIAGKRASISVLKAQQAAETDRDARHAIGLALARLRDAAGREAYLNQLRSESPAIRAQAVKNYPYVRDRGLLPVVTALVHDRDDAVNVAPGGHRWFKRVCDVVIDMFSTQLGVRFPFATNPTRRYSDDEIQQAAQTLARYR